MIFPGFKGKKGVEALPLNLVLEINNNKLNHYITHHISMDVKWHHFYPRDMRTGRYKLVFLARYILRQRWPEHFKLIRLLRKVAKREPRAEYDYSRIR